MAAETKIAIKGVSKIFQSARGEAIEALSAIDINIREGEFLTIVGPSGCGKSTLLNILSGFEKVSNGSITLNGKAVDGPGPERGVVFQDYGLFPWLTVGDNIAFGPRSIGLTRKETEARVVECLRMVNLDGARHQYPSELSGGMRQRCALARCIANDPDVMLMDEPLAALDALTRLSLQEELLNIWSEASRSRPKTVLYITHAIDEAVYLSDRVIVMSARPGRIRREIAIPFARPRDPEIRTDPIFHEISDEIWRLLRNDETPTHQK